MNQRFALDRASVRTIDQDGHLHVKVANISKANVCPYYGREIPDAERLGLKPGQVYQLLRDPDELATAAASFNGKPLLSLHRPQTANDHAHELTVGSVANVRWTPPYLQAELVVWDAGAIAGIETGQQRELSSAYRYRADMVPGTYQGVRYDGVMRAIRGNHVALVDIGRGGPDVVVGDAMPKNWIQAQGRQIKGNKIVDEEACSKLLSYLGEILSQEDMDNVKAILHGQEGASPSANTPAMDALGRQLAARHRMRTMQADATRRTAQFPNANRLHG